MILAGYLTLDSWGQKLMKYVWLSPRCDWGSANYFFNVNI